MLSWLFDSRAFRGIRTSQFASRGATSLTPTGSGTIGFARRFDQPPGLRFLENLRGELGVQRVAGAMRHQVTDDRIADERQVADRVENLVTDELVFEPQRVVEIPVSPSTIAFSSEPPSARPFCRITSTSFRKVKVRAGATSSVNDSSVMRSVRDWWRRSGWSKLML